MQPQEFHFDQKIAENIEIEILSVYKGSKYDDTCIAELDFHTPEGWLFNP